MRGRKLREEKSAPLNWPMLWHSLWEDHTRPDLLWNQRTREELREAVTSEVKDLRRAQTLSTEEHIQWNHLEFEVLYPSLEALTRTLTLTLTLTSTRSFLSARLP